MAGVSNPTATSSKPRLRFTRSSTEPFKPFKIFTPTPILGYGYDLDEFWQTVDNEQPAAIIVDAGSTDPGPYMLGTGKTLCSKASYVRDLTPILEACATYGTKFMVSSAGGAGTNAQLDFLVGVIGEIVEANAWEFKLASIKFNDDRELFFSKLRSGKTLPCGPGPELTESDVRNATAIVAQMGAEPFMHAMQDEQIDIIVAGRSYDPAPFAAFCMLRGVDESPAWHVGKIIECGGLCAVPKGRSILATMYQNHFVLTPTNPAERCTPVSAAAHTLYEKTRPDRLPGPGGTLHLDHATYEQLSDGRSVRAQGSRFVPTPAYQIKLEGAEQIGFRTMYIGGIRDPILICEIDAFLETVRKTTKDAFPDFEAPGGPQLIFHVYGKNAVMGPLEIEQPVPHELGIMGEVVASSQEVADAVAGFSRTVLLHGSYDGQLATGGNVASPLTPLETSLGPVFKFSLYHLMEVDDPAELFPISTTMLGSAKQMQDSTLRGDQARVPRKAKRDAKAPAVPAPLPPNPDSTVQKLPRGPLIIREIASVVRSKNSGPFEITLDILFANREAYERARASSALTREVIQELYQLSPNDIIVLMFFEPALAWKCTFKRPWPQGSIGERDTFGAQMHAPLLSIVVDELSREAAPRDDAEAEPRGELEARL